MFSLTSSRLFDQSSFYRAFLRDLGNAKRLVVIQSPFITKKRMDQLLPALSKLRAKGVRIIINTKPFEEHDTVYEYESQAIWAVGVIKT